MKRKTLPFLLCMSVATPALAIQPIVGSWLVNDPDGYTVVTFREDGSYILGLDFAGDPTHTGVEWGSYVWDGNPGSTYGLIAATASGDTNGNWGIANDEDGPVKFEVSGNSGIFSSPFATSSTTPLTASRVVHFPGTIIGSWTIPNEAPVSANFFADGTYILAESGIADNDGGPGRNMRAQSITLPAGSHQLEVRYAKQESWYANGLGLFVAGPGLRRQALHAEGSLPPDSQAANPIYAHFQPEPAVLRSFIDFQGPADSTAHRIPHAISVGFPERVSYSYNLQSGALFQVWKSGFLDVTPMWHSRGDGSARPMGSLLALQDAPPLALLPSALAPWPLEVEAPAHFRPGGYRLDEKRQPTFYYEAYNMKAADQLTPAEGGKLLERKIELLGEAPPGLYFRLAAGQKIDKMPNNTYAIDQRYYIKLPEKVAFSPILRDVQGGQELLVPLEGIQVVAYQLVW